MCGLIFLSFGGEDVADYAFRTLEDRQKIEKLWEDGRTPKEISETTGVSVHVGRLLRFCIALWENKSGWLLLS